MLTLSLERLQSRKERHSHKQTDMGLSYQKKFQETNLKHYCGNSPIYNFVYQHGQAI